jgi:uncharacterized protein YjiS (DUF1127 family)
MSLKKSKSVPQLVEKYTQQYPAYSRRDLRKWIRIDNPLLFSEEKNSSYQSNLKKLDRYLKKTYLKKASDRKLSELSDEELSDERLSDEEIHIAKTIIEQIKLGHLIYKP